MAHCEAASGRYDTTMIRIFATLILSILSSHVLAQAPLDRDAKIAFLGITFLDTSTEGDYFGARDDEAARLDLMEAAVIERFEQEGFTFLDLGPIAEELEGTVNPAKCYGCDIRMGQKLGADYILLGEIQKVSNLILSMNLVVKDVETGQLLRGRSVDIRSNTDDSWLRGIRYIMKNSIFRE